MKLDNFLINDYLLSGEWKSAIDAVAAHFNLVLPVKCPVYVATARSENRLVIYGPASACYWNYNTGFTMRVNSYNSFASSHINIWAPVNKAIWTLL
jgi:hypothetical protein